MSFLVVGGLSTAVDGGMFLLLTTLGLHPVAASALGFATAFAVNYTGNRSLVFRSAHSRRTLGRYVVLVIINFSLSAGLVAAGIAVGLIPIVAKVISIVIIAAINYVAMRRWVFRAQQEPPADVTPATTDPAL